MGYQNAYTAYRDTAVKTASQGRLIVLLYQAAVRELDAARRLFESDGSVNPRNIEAYGKHITKTQEIIGELQVSLDMDKGGQIAQNLMSLYVYFNHELVDASINKNRDKLEFVYKMMNELSSAWETASNSQANAPAQTIQPALNITG